MASVEQIKKVILDVAGNPGVGIIAELADKWAVSIAALDDKTLQQVNAKDGKGDAAVKDGTKNDPAKEIRVTKSAETR